MNKPSPAQAPQEETVSRKRFERERTARLEAEKLLETRSRELFDVNLRMSETLERERHLALLQLQLVSSLSHEFRTPLTVIDGSAERLNKLAQKCRQAEAMEERCLSIRTSVQRLTQILDQCTRAMDLHKRTD